MNVNERDPKESESNFPPLTPFGTFLMIYLGVKDSRVVSHWLKPRRQTVVTNTNF
jgi:hypothetical protein